MTGAGAIRAGRAFVEANLDDTKLVRGLRRAQAKMKAFGAGVSSIGRSLLAVSAAGLTPFIAGIRTFISMGDELDKMSKRTGFSVETLSELKFAARETGTDLSTLERGIKTMQRSITDAGRGLSTQVDALGDLGLSYDDLASKSPEEQFKLIADRIASIEDPTKRAALAQMLLGRAGTQLLPLFERGAAGIEEFQRKAREMGLTLSTEAAADAAKLGDTLGQLWDIIKIGAFSIGAQLAPSLITATKALHGQAMEAVAWIKTNREMIVTIAQWIAKIGVAGVALVAVGGTIQLVAGTVGTLIGVIKGLGAAMAFLAVNPMFLALGAIVAGFVALGIAIDRASQFTAQLNDSFAKARAAGDQMRAQDLDRIQRLQQLAAKEKLSNSELEEAQGIVVVLTDRYGDLGIQVSAATGAIEGVAAAGARLLKVFQQMTIRQLQQELDEARKNTAELKKEFDAVFTAANFGANFSDSQRIPDKSDTTAETTRVQKQAAEARRKLEDALRVQRETQRRIDAIRGGNLDALTAAPGSTAAGSPPATESIGATSDIDALRSRVDQLGLEGIENQAQRELALIRFKFEKEIELAKLEENNEEKLSLIKKARRLEIEALERQIHQRVFAEKQRQIERIAMSEKQLQREIEQLEISIAGGPDVEGKLLELRRQNALEDAREEGINPNLINRRFDLQLRAIDTMQGAAEPALRTVGSFSGAELAGMAFPGSQTIDKTEEKKTAEEAKKIAETAEQISNRLSNIEIVLRESGLAFA